LGTAVVAAGCPDDALRVWYALDNSRSPIADGLELCAALA
jgi:hypothetical protein